MFIQALTEYAGFHLVEDLNDIAWTTKRVQWRIEISRDGEFLRAIEHQGIEALEERTNRIPTFMAVARSPVRRNNGKHALLGTDEVSYVLGIGSWTPEKLADQQKAKKHHEAFLKLLQRAAVETGDIALAACARFYADADEVRKARESLRTVRVGALVALDVDG